MVIFRIDKKLLKDIYKNMFYRIKLSKEIKKTELSLPRISLSILLKSIFEEVKAEK